MQISNRTILSLLIIALVITVVGTAINVNRLLGGTRYASLSGAITATGTSTLNITSTASITNQQSTIAFGTGYVNSSCNNCTMNSTGGINATCCINFTTVSNSFLLENTGNVNLSVNYTCSGNCTAATFIGGAIPVFQIMALPNSAISQAGELSPTDTDSSCGSSWTPSSWADVNSTGGWLCGSSTDYLLNTTATANAGIIAMQVVIFPDAPSGGGVKTATFTFNAFSSG